MAVVIAVVGLPALAGVPMAGAATNGALQLNGSSQYSTLGTLSQLRSAQFTAELWFKRTGAGVGVTTGTGGVASVIPLITKGTSEAENVNADFNYFVGIDAASGRLVADFEEAQVAQGGTTPGLNHPITGTAVIAADSTWHHAAATYDGAGWNLYLDGVLDGTLAVGRPANALTNALTSVGSSVRTTGVAQGFFAGVTDEVRIWNSARSLSQIQAAMDTEITTAQSGLLGAWNLNEGTGSSLADSSGNAVTGTTVANPTWTAGFEPPAPATNGALQLNGSSQYSTLGTLSQLRSAQFTAELWFKRTGAGVGVTTGTGGVASVIPLITKGTSEAENVNADFNYFVGIDAASGRLVADFEEAQVAQGGTTPGLNHPITGTAVIAADSTWHHAAATYDGAGWNLYLDGVLDGTLAVGRPANALTNALTSVGSSVRTTGVAQGFFAGVTDEVRIWNSARSLSQIQAAMDTEITTAQSGLLGAWNLNEGTGSSLADSSGNAVTGTTVANPTWTAGFEPPAPGNTAPAVPTLNAPTNGATGVASSPTLDVVVSDPESNPLTVTYFGRPYASGNYVQIGQHAAVTAGSSDTTVWSSPGEGQTFQWFVTVNDGSLTTTGPVWTFHTSPGVDPVFVGAGDIADCTRSQDEATAAVIGAVDGTVWTTGDNVYPTGTAANFTNCYEPSWGGAIKARTRPVSGNHDYGTGSFNNLNDYFGYFGANATDAAGKSYYSYDIPSSNWHIVNLDSECALVTGGCGAGSPQELWLRADLAANSDENVIALVHKPRYSSGVTNLTDLQAMFGDLYEFGVDLVLQGHDHIYERSRPMNAAGNTDLTYGFRVLTVGTGGASLQSCPGTLRSTGEVCNSTYGVVKLTLHASSYDWKFLPIAGSSFTDSGTQSVHDAPPTAPGPPTIATATAGDASAQLMWTAPASDGGSEITGYRVTPYIGATAQAPINVGNVTSTTIVGLVNGTGYTFRVAATNAVGTGTQSAASNVVTPNAAPTVPGTPTIGSATPGNAAATVTWSPPAYDGGSAITGYEVTPYIGAAAQPPVSVGSVTSTTVTGLANGTSYTFRVAATNAVGTGTPTADSNAVTPATTPSAPTGATAVAGNAEATVSWTAPVSDGGSAITGYTVTPYIGATPQPEVTVGDLTSTTITGLANGTHYVFTVAAINAIGTGELSDATNAVTPATVPGAPTGATAVAGNAEATVSWTAPVSDGGSAITGYTVTPYLGAVAQAPVDVGNVTSAAVTGLTNGSAYTFTVTAVNSTGAGPASSASTAVTPTAPTTVPGAPTAVSAVAGNAEATVSWSAPVSDGGSAITGYIVTPYVGAIPQATIPVGATATSQVVTGLTNGMQYVFTVAAVNAIGTGGYSTASNAVTPATLPGVPTIGVAVVGNGQATVSWSAPLSDGGSPILGYVVTPFVAGVSQGPRYFPGPATSQTIMGLTNGTTYRFKVRAWNSIGVSGFSAASNAVTPATAPGAPTGVFAVAGSGSASVSWTSPASTGGSPIIGYIVTPFVAGVSQGPRYFLGSATSQTITGLANGTTYRFKVRAWNAVGVSSFSGTSNPATPSPAP